MAFKNVLHGQQWALRPVINRQRDAFPPSKPLLATHASSSSERVGDHVLNNRLLDTLSERRLLKLNNFYGDISCGFESPDREAIKSVRILLEFISAETECLQPPSISPAADGEIVVSWRRKSGFLVLSFELGTQFDWIFGTREVISGTSDVRNVSIRKILIGMLDSIACATVAARSVERLESRPNNSVNPVTLLPYLDPFSDEILQTEALDGHNPRIKYNPHYNYDVIAK